MTELIDLYDEHCEESLFNYFVQDSESTTFQLDYPLLSAMMKIVDPDFVPKPFYKFIFYKIL